MIVEEMIDLLKQMPPKQELKIVEDGNIYDWVPTRVYNDACVVYITNKKPVRKKNRVRRSTTNRPTK